MAVRQSRIEGSIRLYDDVNLINLNALEISRRTNLLRGGPLLFSLVFLALGLVWTIFLSRVVQQEWQKESDYLFQFFGLLLIWLIGTSYGVTFLFRLDASVPVDTPVRFSRPSGKVQAYEFQWTWNPFTRWSTVIKEFDWANVQAEIQKQAGFTGKAYVVRYALVLCVCKPGTFEVIDRITLKSNRILTEDLKHIWNYLRRYMAEGPEGLPPVTLLPTGISFRRSFFEYMRWWDPTSEGRQLRRQMPGWLVAINSVFTLLMLPLFAALGVCHYIAMRLAPEPDWEGATVVRVGALGTDDADG